MLPPAGGLVSDADALAPALGRVDFTRYAREAHIMTPEEAAQEANQRAADARAAWDKALLAAAPWRATDRVVARTYADDWPAVQLARLWLTAPDSPPHVMFRGPPRSGKTLASALLVQHWVEPGKGRGAVLALHPNALISAMLHDYDEKSPKIGPTVRLVVVDDIGRESKQAGLVESLCMLLDRRNLRVVMSTNLSKLDFRKVYDDPRLLERLRETTYAADVKAGGERHAPGDF